MKRQVSAAFNPDAIAVHDRSARPSSDYEFAFTEDDFGFIAELVRCRTGIMLAGHKRNLVYSRLVRRLRILGLSDFRSYCDLLKDNGGSGEISKLINAITTNLTSFFRENHHFDHLYQTALPAVMSENSSEKRLRIWSAACSTGEEPYSIAMTVMRSRRTLDGWNVRILATDLDTDVLSLARKATYNIQSLKNLPAPLNSDFITSSTDSQIQIDASIRKLISFKELNLLDSWPMKGPFDVIFCRNVLIYFSGETKSELINRFSSMLRLGGWLYLGHSETLSGGHSDLMLTDRTTYRKIS